MCYVCSGTGPGSNCEVNPANFEFGPGTINCSANYCSAVKVIKKGEEISYHERQSGRKMVPIHHHNGFIIKKKSGWLETVSLEET